MQERSRGRQLADRILDRVAVRVAALQGELGRAPQLGIIAGADDAARRFVELKRLRLAAVGIALEVTWLDANATTAEAVDAVAAMNARDDVDAIFVQFPLPDGIDPAAVANAIDVQKDIDCSSERAERAFLSDESNFVPVAPQAAVDLLVHELGKLAGKRIAIYDNDTPFGRGLTRLLRNEGAEVQSVDRIADVDVLVVSEDLPPAGLLLAAERLDVLFDAGYYLPPRGDFIPPPLQQRIGIHLLQYGNVGPLTVAHIAQATIAAARRGMQLAGKPSSDRE